MAEPQSQNAAHEGAVRLYGHDLGFSSFSQVTRGFRLALDAIGQLGGFVPIDCYEEEQAYSGGSCPIGVNTGMPSASVQSRAAGHAERLLMLAPNSDQIPEAMKAFLPEMLTGLLAPSQWGKRVLERLVALPVWCVPHGVAAEYSPDRDATATRLDEFRAGKVRALHMTSTNSERKGTKLLLRAWRRVRDLDATLIIVCRYDGYAELRALVDSIGFPARTRVSVYACDGMPPDAVLRLFRGVHFVCQPSRAEGFGLVPLEAKAAGVPVVMTGCTGHADHVMEGACVQIETGEEALTDDMHGARAPSVTDEAIFRGIEAMLASYPDLADRAYEQAESVRSRWSWPNTTGRAMRQIIGELL